MRVGVGEATVRVPDTEGYRVNTSGGASDVINNLGNDSSSSRRITVESGVGSVRIDPELTPFAAGQGVLPAPRRRPFEEGPRPVGRGPSSGTKRPRGPSVLGTQPPVGLSPRRGA
uniref:Uncharacterized protein n=1 Tax=Janibacter limosus TaxID=53458 RepID=A0AC61U9A8_9MICO|nr:hypothetical protein [Janibacter limosus]